MIPIFSAPSRLALPAVVLLSLAAFVAAYALLKFTHLPFSLLSFQAETGGRSILNVLPFYTAETAYEHISAYSPQTVRIYHRIILLDVVLLIPLYVLFLRSALLHAGGDVLSARSSGTLRALTALPLAAAALNLLEDASLLTLIHAYPNRLDTLATLAGGITATKTLLLTLSFLAVLALYCVFTLRYLSSRLRLRPAPLDG